MASNHIDIRRSGKVFSFLLSASTEELKCQLASETLPRELGPERRMGATAAQLGLRKAQLVCALGFNAAVPGLIAELAMLGYPSYEELARHRNQVFATDIYRELSLEDVQSVYRTARRDPRCRALVQYLVPRRLAQIETEIDATVGPTLIDRYQREVRYFYRNAIAQPEFAEARLSQGSPGFRALCDEFELLVEAKLLSGSAIIEHPALAPAEKRRLLERGFANPRSGSGVPIEGSAAEDRHSVFETSVVLGAK